MLWAGIVTEGFLEAGARREGHRAGSGAQHSTPLSQLTTAASSDPRQTLFLTLRRSHHQEERQGWAHSEKPVRQPVDPQQTPPHHFHTHPHHGLEAAHAQGHRIDGQGE